MDKEKLKLIVKNLELIVESLKEEISNEKEPTIYEKYEEIRTHLSDYDEVFYDGDDDEYSR